MATGFSFGSGAATPAGAGGGLFGGGGAGLGNPPQSSAGGLFSFGGGTSSSFFSAASTSASGQSKPAFSFGAPASTTAAGNAGAGFNFGAQSGGGLFSSPTSASAPLFGSTGQSLFSSASAPSASTGGQGNAGAGLGGNLFSGLNKQPSAFGGLQQNAQQSSPFSFGGGAQGGVTSPFSTALAPQQAQSSTSLISGSTQFSQLPEELKNRLLMLERYMKEQRLTSARLAQKLGGTENSFQMVKDSCDSMLRQVTQVRHDLEQDRARCEALKADVRAELKSAENTAVTLESARSSPSVPAASLARFLFPFFSTSLQRLETRAVEFKHDMDEVEESLRCQNGSKPRAQAIEDILRRLHEYFILVASNMATLHETVRSLKESYLDQLSRRHPEAFDPFEDAARRDAAMKIRTGLQTLQSAEAAMNNLRAATNKSPLDV